MKTKWIILWSTMVLQMKNSFTRPMYRFCLIMNPIANTILLYYMFKSSGEDDFITYVILGAGLMGLWCCICFSSAGDINRERFYGTLSAIYAAPADFQYIICGKVLGNTFLSLATFSISYFVAKILFGASLGEVHIQYLFIALLAVIVTFAIVSIGIAYILTLSRKTGLYMNCIEVPITLLCGFAFPVEILPNWIQPISNCLAPTWAVRLLRLSVEASIDANKFYYVFVVVCIINLVGLVINMLLYRMIDKKIRMQATLEVS